MSDSTEAQQAATEAAQHVVDEVTSYEYSAEKDVIADKLRSGLAEAGVAVDAAQQDELVEKIDALKGDEDAGTPDVASADPA